MIVHSFRYKIVLWSVVISSTVLLVFSWVVWLSLKHDSIASLDESLSTFGIRHATRATPKADTQRMEISLAENFGEEKSRTRFFALLTSDGHELHRSAGWPDQLKSHTFPAGDQLLDPQPKLPPPSKQDERKGGRRDRPVFTPTFHNVSTDRESYRVGVFANGQVKIVVGANLNELSRETKSLRQAFLVALPGAVFLIALGAWLLSRRALRPIISLRRDMQSISAQALDSRLEVEGAASEFSGIIDQYNAMLERLERSFRQATRFSGDASHELKTPLAIMRGTLERALAESGDDPVRQAAFSDLLEQTDRQKAVLENLLLLSRADSGQLKTSASMVNLSEAVNMWLEDAGLLAEAKNITIHSEIEPGIEIPGDKNLLQQVAHNLFSNSVRHNVEAGEISCRLSSKDNEAIWEISNTGPLLAEGETCTIFDRFYRGKDSGSGGTGLGLSLVKEIISAHGGTVTASVEGGKNVFLVKFPKITIS